MQTIEILRKSERIDSRLQKIFFKIYICCYLKRLCFQTYGLHAELKNGISTSTIRQSHASPMDTLSSQLLTVWQPIINLMEHGQYFLYTNKHHLLLRKEQTTTQKGSHAPLPVYTGAPLCTYRTVTDSHETQVNKWPLN